MNLKTKVNEAMGQIRALEGKYIDSVKMGSNDMEDYLELRYLSGLRNGFAFFKHIFEDNISEEDFNKMLKEVLYQELVN